MKRYRSLIRKTGFVLIMIFKTLPRLMCWCLLLVLPVGYYPDDTDSTKFVFGVHRGQGQIASVVRGCNGQALHSEKSDFSDYSAEAYWPISRGDEATIVGGLRMGHFQTDWGVATRDGNRGYVRSEDRLIEYSYYNPNLSIETRKVGFGFGFIGGSKIQNPFDANSELSGPKRPAASFHLRFGRLDETYFIMSYAENTPLVSAGGLFDIGLGYRIGKSADFFTGLAGGTYDRSGFVQQARVKLGGPVHLDFSLRLGSAGNVFENAFSTGLTIKLGKRSASKTKSSKPKRRKRGRNKGSKN